MNNSLIFPTILMGYAALFAACWVPLLLGWVTDVEIAIILGMVSGAPVSVILLLVAMRLMDGTWLWDPL